MVELPPKQFDLSRVYLSIIFCGTICFLGEEVENVYGQAANAGIIERGWIPVRLPETAVNIHEKHNMDTNADLLFFTTGDHFTFPEGCHADGTAPNATLPAEWWPGAGLWRCLFIRATTAFWRSTKHLQLFISGAREPLLAQ